eukprot:TRINITY_DN17994_c0_g1_i1.p1 TRINITY_DN17994_c0_g1~~TRINITY_DN17994_c0_g1_i1.p1  ORF type:complete len:260 (-),score=105.91 TRINITY_DN17994_c0_g1_i1:72-851(-)
MALARRRSGQPPRAALAAFSMYSLQRRVWLAAALPVLLLPGGSLLVQGARLGDDADDRLKTTPSQQLDLQELESMLDTAEKVRKGAIAAEAAAVKDEEMIEKGLKRMLSETTQDRKKEVHSMESQTNSEAKEQAMQMQKCKLKMQLKKLGKIKKLQKIMERARARHRHGKKRRKDAGKGKGMGVLKDASGQLATLQTAASKLGGSGGSALLDASAADGDYEQGDAGGDQQEDDDEAEQQDDDGAAADQEGDDEEDDDDE